MKKNVIKNVNVILEERYLKQKSIIIESLEPPKSEDEYISIIKNNGFTQVSSTDPNTVWKYENSKTQVFTFKTKDGKLYVSQRGFYNPKTDLHIPTTTTSFKIPVTTEYQKYWDRAVNDYIQSKNIYDPSWSLENINDLIKKIEDNLKITNDKDIVTVGGVFIRNIKSVEENINKWLVDPDKQLAKNNLNQLKGLAKEKGLNFV